jgi:hypothetical protein
VSQLVDRIVRRSQYEALKAVLDVLDGWLDDGCLSFTPVDVRRIVNDAALELRVPEPYQLDA